MVKMIGKPEDQNYVGNTVGGGPGDPTDPATNTTGTTATNASTDPSTSAATSAAAATTTVSSSQNAPTGNDIKSQLDFYLDKILDETNSAENKFKEIDNMDNSTDDQNAAKLFALNTYLNQNGIKEDGNKMDLKQFPENYEDLTKGWLKQIRLLSIKKYTYLLFGLLDKYSFKSLIDYNLPDLGDLNIDYKKLLGSYFVQRIYFSRLKPNRKVSCNSQSILDALDGIVNTISFLFDGEDNLYTKLFVNKKTQQKGAGINQTVVDLSFNNNPEILRWIQTAKTSKNDAGVLSNLNECLEKLPINDSLKNDPQVTLYASKGELETNGANEEQKMSIQNIIKRLHLISLLCKEFQFRYFRNYKF